MTAIEILGKIKEISMRAARPRPLIEVIRLAGELQQTKAELMPALSSLKEHRLIKFNEPAALFIKLTLLGDMMDR